jgi:hypothetical protein
MLRCGLAQPSARRPSRGQRRGAPSPNAALSAPGALLASCFGAAGVHAVNTQRGVWHNLQRCSAAQLLAGSVRAALSAPRLSQPARRAARRAERSGAFVRQYDGRGVYLHACLQRPKSARRHPLPLPPPLSAVGGRASSRTTVRACTGLQHTQRARASMDSTAMLRGSTALPVQQRSLRTRRSRAAVAPVAEAGSTPSTRLFVARKFGVDVVRCALRARCRL